MKDSWIILGDSKQLKVNSNNQSLMNNKIDLSTELSWHNPEFIRWFDGNPFARLFCRTIVNKMCSGSCWNCNKEREVFKEEQIAKLRSRNNNGDPHFEDVYWTPEEVWANWITLIQREKLKFWERRSEARRLREDVFHSITTLH